MNKKFFYFFSILAVGLLLAKKALAVCPLCTIAVSAGLGLSRWLGVDDSISGLWIGGLIVSMIFWTISWFSQRNIRFRGITILTVVSYYAIVILPLYFYGILGDSQNSLFCFCGFHFDKLSLGIVAGSAGFYFGASWYNYLKEKNQGRAYFPFQKVAMPLAPLGILTILFYFLTK